MEIKNYIHNLILMLNSILKLIIKYKLIIYFGLTYHCIQLTINYTKFSTYVKIEYIITPKDQLRSLSFCLKNNQFMRLFYENKLTPKYSFDCKVQFFYNYTRYIFKYQDYDNPILSQTPF